MNKKSDKNNIYEESLEKQKANYSPLTPLSFISRAAKVYGDKTAVIHGDREYTWLDTYNRSKRLASALNKIGIGEGDTVAFMGSNTPELYEAHFGVPMSGAVLNALNIRLDAKTIAYILDHGEAKVLFTDREFSETIKDALKIASVKPTVIDVDDVLAPPGDLLGKHDYEAFIDTGVSDYHWAMPSDEWNAISLNYTSGTTGNPKGVVYHHRGAYMNAIGDILSWNMSQSPIYLWTLPMFHCNGWCFPWVIAAMGGTNICLRNINAKEIYEAIDLYRVDHMCGAPIVLGMILNAPDDEKNSFSHTVKIMTAGAPPPASIIQGMESSGFNITHTYGLTETYGPSTVCAWRDEWNEQSIEEQAVLKARQGVEYPVLESLSVRNPETMEPVPSDGLTMGEVMMRGNNVMKGYLKNNEATEEAFTGGYFHSGDLGVMHPNGYIELKDRSKDIIISGGENISSIEIENTLYSHPQIIGAAVVAKSDEKWGETPCAFVELREGAATITEDEIIDYCRNNMAHFKCPKNVVFGPLPKTSTGKIQKFLLRKEAEKF